MMLRKGNLKYLVFDIAVIEIESDIGRLNRFIELQTELRKRKKK